MGIAGLRLEGAVLPWPEVHWNRLLVVVFVGAALLLLRTGATERAEIPDARSAVESVFSDDATVPAPVATVKPTLIVVRDAVSDSPDLQIGRLFVSEIFRPPTPPLGPAGVVPVTTSERSGPCSVCPYSAAFAAGAAGGAIAPARCPSLSLLS
jgi:hypothetical protein